MSKNITESKFFKRTDNNISALIECDKRIIKHIHEQMLLLKEKVKSLKNEIAELKEIQQYREENSIKIEDEFRLLRSKE
ncbi:hypothetical protein J6W34_03380 [bacterium]|nr:hypothetical protein [bacterium]